MVILRRCDILNHPGGLKGNKILREGLTAGPSHFAYVPIELRTVSNKACKRRKLGQPCKCTEFFALPVFSSSLARNMRNRTPTLLLRRRRLLGLCLRSLLPHPNQPRVTPRVSKRPIRVLCSLWHLTLLYLPNCRLLGRVSHWHVLLHETTLLVMFLNVFFRGVHFLVLASLAGEEDETLAVGLETGDVCGERFL